MTIRKVQWELIRTVEYTATAEVDEDKLREWLDEQGRTDDTLETLNADDVQYFLFETVYGGPEWVESDGQTVDVEHRNLELL